MIPIEILQPLPSQTAGGQLYAQREGVQTCCSGDVPWLPWCH